MTTTPTVLAPDDAGAKRQYARVELWAASVILLLHVFYRWLEEIDKAEMDAGDVVRTMASWAIHTPLVLFYLAFLAWVRWVDPPQRLPVRQTVLRAVLVSAAVAAVMFHQQGKTALLLLAASLVILLAYLLLKRGAVWLMAHAQPLQFQYPFVTPLGLYAAIIWVIGIFLHLVFIPIEAGDVMALWVVSWPSAIALYWASIYHLVPQALRQRKPYLHYGVRVAAGLGVLFVVTALLTHVEIGIGNLVLQVVVTVPVSWWLYQRNKAAQAELHGLRQELGQTTASIESLRNQVNPHFLFNALNTIYGLSIREQAPLTSEGIDRLASMMRFMLRENTQNSISLAREVEYLQDYIALQRLRIDEAEGIAISVSIPDALPPLPIAPMLLIPFVENAFKHGVSMLAPSHIDVQLTVTGSALAFFVRNSKHSKGENDPERHNNGIGLANVRQRLHVLYPWRHQLLIQETEAEFVVQLQLELSSIQLTENFRL